MKITEPGVYDIPVDEYHADPVEGRSLSSTGARKLLAPSCPALFRYDQLNPPAPKPHFDFGHAAHKIVLGAGAEIVVVADEWGQDPNEWRTKAVKERVAEVRADGGIPIKPGDFDRVTAMAEALRAHPIAAALLAAGNGAAEQTLAWRDERTGVWRRALLDWLPDEPASRGRLIITDYKTAAAADNDSIQKAAHSHGYHQQAAWYEDGVAALGLGEPAFVFIFQEKTAPYLVNVVQLDAIAMRLGRERNREAIDLYRKCVAADRWPGYSDEIELIPLPAWIENQYLKESA